MKKIKEQLPDTLYYYCSLDTFFNIIKNKSLWLTEIGKSNDSLEQKYLATEIICNLKDYIKFRCEESVSKAEIERLQNEFYNKISTKHCSPVWAICFSEKEDDLSQWRGYADDANGVCIGFSTSYLNMINELSDLCDNVQLNDCFRLRKIEYGEEAINNYLNFLSENFIPIISANEIQEKLERDLEGTYIRPYYKHAAFKSEAEWRMVYTKITCEKEYRFNFKLLNSILEKNKKFHIIGREYDTRNAFLQSHIELKIVDLLSAINVIYIGPKSKLTIEELVEFLRFSFGESKLEKDMPSIEYSSAFSYR
ncbi:MAG: DUF2971 domain-containing protein [Clostridia bacterium]|jgi:hypothetical protein|nr:DUF2971 domain-containing protein [Clostridia bacterium]